VSAERYVGSGPVTVVGDAAGARHIWLCADDYGISPSVSAAIRDLVVRGRINATSAMVVAPGFSRSEAASLSVLNGGMPRVAIGLHLTLTGPFRPISKGFVPTRDGVFPTLGALMRAAFLRKLKHETLAVEIAAQLSAFVSAFGRSPDFIDGHQHVHLFPQIREAVLQVVKELAPNTWVRQCGRAVPLSMKFSDRKGLFLDIMSRSFRKLAAQHGVRTNPAFAGTYDFSGSANFAALFPRFLESLPEGSVVMCHPGFVDAELRRVDPLTTLREREYAFFTDDSFPTVLATHRISLV
jgi:predicted glycoside hydrolase/deacetylase ChbG (UPF0249 family)